MPRNRKKKNKAPQSSVPSQVSTSVALPFPVVAVERECYNSSPMADVYNPSVYHGGFVDRTSYFKETFTSIVCQTEYSHLSPEVLHMCTSGSIFLMLSNVRRRCASLI